MNGGCGELIMRSEPETASPRVPTKLAGKRSSVPTGGIKGGLDPEPQQGM